MTNEKKVAIWINGTMMGLYDRKFADEMLETANQYWNIVQDHGDWVNLDSRKPSERELEDSYFESV